MDDLERRIKERNAPNYEAYFPTPEMQPHFPLVKGFYANSREKGPCHSENWENVLAHAHTEEGIICVRDGMDQLFRGNGRPISLFLHEYAHLVTIEEARELAHGKEFLKANKSLHKLWKVAHGKRWEALSTLFKYTFGGAALFGIGMLLLSIGWLAPGLFFWGLLYPIWAVFATAKPLFASFKWEQDYYDSETLIHTNTTQNSSLSEERQHFENQYYHKPNNL